SATTSVATPSSRASSTTRASNPALWITRATRRPTSLLRSMTTACGAWLLIGVGIVSEVFRRRQASGHATQGHGFVGTRDHPVCVGRVGGRERQAERHIRRGGGART